VERLAKDSEGKTTTIIKDMTKQFTQTIIVLFILKKGSIGNTM